MYRAYGLLLPQTDFTLTEAVKRLAVKFPGSTITQTDTQASQSVNGWDVTLTLNDGPQVQSESVEIAEKIAGLEDGVDIESCNRRVEVGSETPDPFLEHFGKYQQVIEVLQSFRGLIAVDPKEPALL